MTQTNETHLVLLPGFLGEASDFGRVIEHLPPQIKCQVLSIPSGFSEQTLDWASFENALDKWFKKVQPSLPQRFYLYGYSMGGRLAMGLAKQIAQRSTSVLQGLILEDAHIGLATQEQKAARWEHDRKWAERFALETLSQVLEDWYRQPVFKNLTQAAIQQRVNTKKKLESSMLSQQLLTFSLAKQPDYHSLLSDSRFPIWYISGANDIKFTAIGAELNNHLSTKNDNSFSHIIAQNHGHNVHLENPIWLAQTLMALLTPSQAE